MGWLSGWTYRKKITITGATGAGTNYQIPLLIGESSGASGYNFHLEGKSASFPSGRDAGGDLRFTASDGSTLLDFWVESVSGSSPNRLAKVWVEVTADLGSNQDIYCYFGKASASNASNGADTFPLFDDFPGSSVDTNKWNSDTNAGGTISVGSSILTLTVNTQSSSRAELRSKLTFDVNYAIRALANFPTAGINYYPYLAFSNYDNASYPVTYSSEHGSLCCYGDNGRVNSRHLNNRSSTLVAWTQNAYKVFEVRRTSSAISGLEEGGNSGSVTTNIPTGALSICPAHEAGNPPVSESFLVDWILVRKYVSTEPAFSSAGALETAPVVNYGAMLLMFLG